MPTRQNHVDNAEKLLHDLLAQLQNYLLFLETDLTPILLEHVLRSAEDPTARELSSIGVNSNTWIEQLQNALQWTCLALGEEEWLQSQGADLPRPGSQLRGVFSMPSFLRAKGGAKNHNTFHALQQGRKLRRLENEFGTGFSLLLVPVLPTFRRLSLDEEHKLVQLLRTTDYANIILHAQSLTLLRSSYQGLHTWVGLLHS
jgi:hypothetical protein